jgi:hypothetical protein
MMPVIFAPFGKPACIGTVSLRIEHPGGRAITSYAFAIEIGNMGGKRCHRSPSPALTNGERLDDDESVAAEQAAAGKGGAAPPER